jgi:hypothetical protein
LAALEALPSVTPTAGSASVDGGAGATGVGVDVYFAYGRDRFAGFFLSLVTRSKRF